jgi:outer membrane protein OmpA-like peptidoglycan-associated protein
MKQLGFTKYMIFIALLIYGSAYTQETSNPKEYAKLVQSADKFYNNEDFFSASQEYLKATRFKENDGYADMRLAECYRLNMDYNDAEKWYDRCVLFYRAKYPKLVYWLASVQKTNGKYSDAQLNFSSFRKTFKPVTDEDKFMLKQTDVEYKGCIFAQEQLEQPTKEININLLPFPVNTKNSEFAPVIFYHDSAIVITSARADSKGIELNLATGEARTDNFRYEKKGERWLRTDNEDNFDIVNTSNDDGAGQLNRKTGKYYYTICDPECGIYVSRKINGKFTKNEKLNINVNDGYWNAQPTITPNADTMFFVSKRDGGQGSNDIWMSINSDKSGQKEEWGPAKNMFSINTSVTEIAPFWDPESHSLYFASNGQIGFGGLDIFKTDLYKIGPPVNMGLPYNSNLDDFYFTLGKDKGYIVSNRYGGFGQGDIYSFDRYAKEAVLGFMATNENPTDAESISSAGRLFFFDDQKSVPNTSVFLKDDRGNVIKEAITNANGEFRFDNLAPDKNFKIMINSNDSRIRAKVEYFVNKQGKLEGKIFYNRTNQMQASNSNKVTSDANASIKTTTEITPLVETPKVVEEQKPVAAVEEKPEPEPKKEKIVATPKPAKAQRKIGKVYFENVYYDFNSTDIPSSGKIVLDNLVAFLNTNKNAQVEIKAFTDGLGNTQYNLNLAKERGKACFDYLVSQGVNQTALLIIPVGSAQPIGKNSSFIGRQLNRRVQFTLIGATQNYIQETMTYIVEPCIGLIAIAKKFGMTVDELKSFNGISEAGLKAYSPLRVKKSGNSIIAPQTLASLKQGQAEFKFENLQFVPVE